jgi:predicted RNase H-like nuclease (RuvC/YqgF family)
MKLNFILFFQEKEMKKLSERALSNKEETVQKCEHQIAEMMATLEQYQQENQKIVCQKDKEIEEMKHHIEKSENNLNTEVRINKRSIMSMVCTIWLSANIWDWHYR